jgi:hypothetical protein
MHGAARQRILDTLPDDAVVLDVGGWAKPFPRADWVIDLREYETRGEWGYDGDPADERFSAGTWVARDICAHEPWPFADDQFDFAVCAHTLEDVRDPIAVCAELVRVARAGYIEVPSRLQEQTRGVHGDWVGWGHHHWLIDVDAERADVRFVMKPHSLSRTDVQLAFPEGVAAKLTEEERIEQLWWEGAFTFHEDYFYDLEAHFAYLREPLEAHPQYAAAERRRWRR